MTSISWSKNAKISEAERPAYTLYCEIFDLINELGMDYIDEAEAMGLPPTKLTLSDQKDIYTRLAEIDYHIREYIKLYGRDYHIADAQNAYYSREFGFARLTENKLKLQNYGEALKEVEAYELQIKSPLLQSTQGIPKI